jgi:AcrR family transcriptional regulator
MKNKKALIIQVARKLFSQYGLRKTTVDEIVRDARIGKGTLYQYYKSKEHLFADVIKHESDLLIEIIRNSVEKKDTPQDKLRTFILSKISHMKDLVNLYDVQGDVIEEIWPQVEIERKHYFEQERELIEKILKEGVAKKIFVIKNIHLVSFAIRTALKEFEKRWVIDEDISEVEKTLKVLLDILFKGLEKRKLNECKE